MALVFKDAEKAKDAIMVSQQKEIAKLYEKWADEIGERAKYYSHKSNASAAVSERQMRELQKMLRTTSHEVSNEIHSLIKKNMYLISDAVVADNVKWLESFGFSPEGLNAAFNYVPDEVIRNLVTGQIYDSGWSLSKRIWGDNETTLKDIYQVMAKGLAENKPVYEIAKDLESYVRPSAKLPWNPVIAMKNTKTGKIEHKRIYKRQVDYNAQRLARTLAQHSYQQSFLATTQNNPFITEYIWHSNGSRPCKLCMSRDKVRFKKSELPMDHPNGMCTMEPVVVENMVDQLADWFNNPDGTYPEIDSFAGNFGYKVSKTGTIEDFINKYGKSDKSWGAYVKSMNQIQKAEAKALKDKAGQSWQQWYESNIYSGTGPSANYKKSTKKVVSKIDGFTYDDITKFINNADEDFMSYYKLADFLDKNSGYKIYDLLDGMGNIETKKVTNIVDDIFKTKTVKKATTKVDDVVATKKVVTNANFDQSVWDDMIEAQRDRSFLTKMRQFEEAWEDKLTGVEKRAVYKYTTEGSNSYVQQNGYLRFGMNVSDEVKTTVKKIQSALDKSVTTEDMMLVRGTRKSLYTDIFTGDLKKALDSEKVDDMVGHVFKDPGFLSTSPNGDEFGGDLKFKIFAPAGTKGGYVENNNAFGEREFLLQSNTTYYIEKAEKDSRGSITLYLRIII